MIFCFIRFSFQEFNSFYNDIRTVASLTKNIKIFIRKFTFNKNVLKTEH